MNKNLLCNFLYTVCLVSCLIACDDKEDQVSPELNGTYSNKLSAPTGGDTLILTYSGREFVGKDVHLKMTNTNSANLTLGSILPGEPATLLENIPLTAEGTGYSFGGSGTGNNGTTFTYKGNVRKGKMTLSLTDVKIIPNQLTSNGNWYPVQTGVTQETDPSSGTYTCYHTAFHLVTDNFILSQSATQFETLLGNLLTWFIGQVTFNPDGNITARYGTMPADKTLLELMQTPVDRKETDWTTSPVNLASYYVKDDSLLYIVPNIDMILHQIQMNKQGTKAGESIDAGTIAAIYQQLNKWSTTGIKMTIRKNSGKPYYNGKNRIAYEGDLYLFLDKEELEAFFPLLPLVKSVLPEDILSGPIGSMIEPILNLLAGSLKDTKTLELGIMLDKNK